MTIAVLLTLTLTILLTTSTAATAVRDRQHLADTRRALAAARHAARRDPLTGLPNRAGLTHLWATSSSTRRWLAVLDLNGFKPINDTHGHPAGDTVLCVIATRLTRAGHRVARLGGDEFAVILTDPDPRPAARHIADTIAHPIRLPAGHHVTVTAAIGLTPARDPLTHALARADHAMYQAKTRHTRMSIHPGHHQRAGA